MNSHPTIPVALAPHNTEAERTVLAALLIDPDAIYTVAPTLQSNDFYDPVHRSIYQAIIGLMEQGIKIDFVVVANQLAHDKKFDDCGGSAFLAEITASLPTASHILQYVEIVRGNSRKRQLIRVGHTIAAMAQEQGKSADELTELAEQEFLKVTRQPIDCEPAKLADLRFERYDHYVARFEGHDAENENAVRTGFPAVDAKLGSLDPGELIVLAARPSMGKTSLALDIARNVALKQGKSVTVFSREMEKEKLHDRLFAQSLGIEAWKLDTGKLTQRQFEQMGHVFDQFAEPAVFLDDDFNADLVHLRSKARRQQMRCGLDLLIVDYLQLIEFTDRSAGENQTQRITYISKSLKRLARELQCPVLALSQLSRECDRRPDKRPQLSDLRDSGSIEQDGDKILMLYREGEYFEDCADPNATDVLIRKNRNGPTGIVELRFDKTRMTFCDSET